MFLSIGDRNLGVAFQTHPGVRPRLEGKHEVTREQPPALSDKSKYHNNVTMKRLEILQELPKCERETGSEQTLLEKK